LKNHTSAAELKIGALCKLAMEDDADKRYDDASRDFSDMLQAINSYQHALGNSLLADCSYNAFLFYARQNNHKDAAMALQQALNEYMVCGWGGSVDYSQYMASMQKRIKLNWHPATKNVSTRTTAIFKINRLGFITDVL